MQRYRPSIRRPEPMRFAEAEAPTKGCIGYNRSQNRHPKHTALAPETRPDTRAAKRRAGREMRLRQIKAGKV